MKSLSVMTILQICLGVLALGEIPNSTMRFANQDHLTGSLEALTTDQISWNSPTLMAPTSFKLSEVLDISFSPKLLDVVGDHQAVVSLTNGDVVRGRLAAVADDAVELDTTFSERLRFNRLMISGIKVEEQTKFLYRGPTGQDEWQKAGDKAAWQYLNANLRSGAAGGIGKELNLPDVVKVAFNVSWRSSFDLKVILFAEDVKSDRPGKGYEITFQQRSIYLRSCKSQKALGHTTNAVILQENENAKIEIQASLTASKIAILVDGEVIEVFSDPDISAAKIGRGLQFFAQNSSPVQLSRIEISEWDGDFQEAAPPIAAGRPFGEGREVAERPMAPVESGRMELRNGDSIVGDVLSIGGGVVTVKTPFREVKIPVGSLRSVVLKPASLERTKLENGDVRGWLPDGSTFVFRLDGVEGDEMLGSNQNFGRARFKLSAFSRIEFNIHDPKFDEIRRSESP